MRRITVAAVAALLLPLTACGANDVSSKSKAGSVPDVTVTPSVEETPEEEAEETEDASGEPFALTDTVTYENDVEVSLSKFTRGVSSDYASPENTPYVKFAVKVVNGSDSTIDTTGLTVSCAYGDEGQTSESIFDDGLDGAPMTKLLKGRSITMMWACELPKDETFTQIEVSPDMESEAAIFTGNIK